jgi:hypothetical protein
MTDTEIRKRAEALVAKHGAEAVIEALTKWFNSDDRSGECEAVESDLWKEWASDISGTKQLFVHATLFAARAQERERCAGILHRALDAAAIDHGEQCVGGCECYENFAEAMMGVEFAIRNPEETQ